jgi:membrane fusion protein (multidrug efflux system)
VFAAAAAPKLWPEGLWPRETGASRQAPAGAGANAYATRRDHGPEVFSVSAVVLAPTRLAETVASTGTLLADEGVELQPEVSGRIVAINFSEGARVREGDLLVKLNDADLRATQLGMARELELAERRERRTAELLAQGFVREDEYDAALNAVHVLQARIALTEAQIAKTEIRAPFEGIAGLRYVSEGAVVGTSTRIATLQRTDTLKVEFSVPEKYADRVRLGSPIAFLVAGSEVEFGGEVYARDPRIDPVTRTLTLRAFCPNPDGRLLPGAYAQVELTLAETGDALMVPAAALIPDLDATYVLVFSDGKAERRRVTTGMRTDTQVQVIGGLAGGEIVITSGLQQIRPGSAVEIDLAGAASISHAFDEPGSRFVVGPPRPAPAALYR